MATESAPSEIIERQRKALLKILQQDPDSILDSLTSRRLISEEEYETLEKVSDPLKKSRKLLILVQRKGEVSCQDFLQCFLRTFPESATAWGLRNEFLKHENVAPPQSIGVSRNSRDTFSPGKNKPENPEITVSSKEKEHLGLETPEFFRDKTTSDKETALSSGENEKEYDAPNITLPYSVEEAECEIPAIITYLKDGQRYEEPDDSLYLGKEQYQESVGHPEDAETTVEEGDSDDPEHAAHDGEEDPEHSEATGSSEEEHVHEDSETSISLEEEDGQMEERKKVFKEVLSRLNMDRSRKLLPDFVKQFSLDRGHGWTPETAGDLAWNFLMKIQALDMTARDTVLRHRAPDEESKEELLTRVENLEIRDIHTMNPLDVICASLLCSDSSLQREVMSNMYKCQFALPLLLPDVESNRCLLMLGATRDIVKQLAQSSGAPTGDSGEFLRLMKMPIVSFVRLGHCAFSKSRILNTLLSPAQMKPHKIFLHRDLSALAPPRQISDGLVEMAWCFPAADELKESPGVFQKPVAVANLRGDLESFWTQFGFLMEVSSAVFFFTDNLGEKEWDLLMFLGEAAIERCYFVLSPQARESEEAELFQRILKLKLSQLLFWEGEVAGERRENLEVLQTAFQEVMSSSLRYVSLEEMASLARELGIQVDQDFENAQGIQVSLSEHMAVTDEGEGIQRHDQPKSSPESQVLMPGREPRAGCEVSQNLPDVHPSPVFMPHLENSWPLPARVGGNMNHVSLKAPWVVGSHFGSEQRSKRFSSLPFWNAKAHSRGKSCGIKYFQPQIFYSGPRFMNISSTSHGHHFNGTFGRPPRPLFQRVWTCPERPQTTGTVRSRVVGSQVSHLHSPGSQPAGTVSKPQPGQTPAQGAQLSGATGKSVRTTSHNTDPHRQSSQPAANIQKLVRPASQQEAQQLVQGGSSRPAFITESHSTSKSKLLPNSQCKSHQSKPPKVKNFQPKPPQPVPSQPKPSQTKPARPPPSQTKPSQPRPTQPKPSRASPSQARACQPRAGTKRAGKH